jgi:hypothetical protein
MEVLVKGDKDVGDLVFVGRENSSDGCIPSASHSLCAS